MEAASRFFFLTITGQYPAGADILGSSLRLADVGVNAVGAIVYFRNNYESKSCLTIYRKTYAKTWSGRPVK